MKITLKSSLLAMSLLVIASSANAKLNFKSVGGGGNLVVNKNIENLQQIPNKSEVKVKKNEDSIKKTQEKNSNDFKKIKAEVANIKSDNLFPELLKIINNNKIEVSSTCPFVCFKKSDAALRSACLLERIINDSKDNNIKKHDIETFDKIMKNLSNEKREMASIFFQQILDMFKNKKTNGQLSWNSENILFDSININQLWTKEAYRPSYGVSTQDMKHEFLLSFIWKYIEEAKSNSPKLAKEIIGELEEVNNFNKLKEQLEYVGFDKYKKNILENLIKTMKIPNIKLTNDDRQKMLDRYELKKPIFENGKHEIEEFKEAVKQANEYQLTDAINTYIQIINKLFKEEVKTK